MYRMHTLQKIIVFISSHKINIHILSYYKICHLQMHFIEHKISRHTILILNKMLEVGEAKTRTCYLLDSDTFQTL